MACRSSMRQRFDHVIQEFETYWVEQAIDFDAIDAPVPLPSASTIEPEAIIIWESLTPSLISDTGVIFPPADQAEIARIRVTIRLDGARRPIERTKTYTLIVMPLEEAFTVTFKSTITLWQTDMVVSPSSIVTPPTLPPEKAFELMGWRLQGTEELVDFSEPLPGPGVYIAVWDDKRYDVTFDSRGGSEVSGFNEVIHSTTLEHIPEPTRPGYQFVGWIFIDQHGNEQLLVEDQTLINQVIHAFALWIPKS